LKHLAIDLCRILANLLAEGNVVMPRSVRYVTDEQGERTAVILPIEEYEDLLEDLHVTHAADETQPEPRIPWTQVRAELISEGKLDAES